MTAEPRAAAELLGPTHPCGVAGATTTMQPVRSPRSSLVRNERTASVSVDASCVWARNTTMPA